MLNGKKILLRPVVKNDAKYFLDWFNDPEVIQYLVMYLPMTEMAEEKWIEGLTTNRKGVDVVFTIESIQKDKVIGNCGLHNINNKDREASFGIAIGNKDFWSKGCGFESGKLLLDYGFNQLNLNRISSSAIAFNERSIKLHKKLGFSEEGIRRKSIFKNGQFWDKINFGLLRKEWMSMGKKSKSKIS